MNGDGPTKPVSMLLDEIAAGIAKPVKPTTYDDIVWATTMAQQYVSKPWPWSDSHVVLVPKETVLGYVEAWRWWPIKSRILLRPIYNSIPWTPGREPSLGPLAFQTGEYIEYFPSAENYARPWEWSGENVADEPPSADNSNGFYAYNLEGIEDHSDCPLFGRVALYGDVIHCKYGYRAEKARILDVWVDKDWIKLYPDFWDEIKDIPQVKGVYDTHAPSVYNHEEEKENYQCLILEHQKELSGTSLSGGLMTNLSSNPSSNQTMLIIDRRSSNQIWWNQVGPTGYFRIPFPYAKSPTATMMDAMSEMTESDVLPGFSRKWVIKPEGPICDICDRLIAKDERVAVSFEYPDNYEQQIFDRTFKWERKQRHMKCLYRQSITPPIFTDMVTTFLKRS